MPFVIWIMLLNALGSSSSFINPARFQIAEGIPVGIQEFSIGLAFVYALFRGGSLHARYPSVRKHPLIAWMLALWILAWVAGAIGTIGTFAPVREILVPCRDYAATAMLIFIGYRLISTPKSLDYFTYLFAALCIGNALCLMFLFDANAAKVREVGNFNPVRQIDYMMQYSCTGFALLVWSILAGVRLIRPTRRSFLFRWLCNPTGAAIGACLCILGGISSVSRTVYIALFVGFVSVWLILPSGKRLGALTKSLVVIPMVVGALYGGMALASVMTNKDFFAKVHYNLESILPGENTAKDKDKAWDSRIPSILHELRMFSKNPLIGQGFGAQFDEVMRNGINYGGYNHNAWTGLLSNTGIIGFSAFALTIFGPMLIGRRMVRERVDLTTILMGATGFVIAVDSFAFGSCTLFFQTRGAMFFALTAGAMVRAREIQETTRLLNEQELVAHQYQSEELQYESPATAAGLSPEFGF
jgi:hypothetical protein